MPGAATMAQRPQGEAVSQDAAVWQDAAVSQDAAVRQDCPTAERTAGKRIISPISKEVL